MKGTPLLRCLVTVQALHDEIVELVQTLPNAEQMKYAHNMGKRDAYVAVIELLSAELARVCPPNQSSTEPSTPPNQSSTWMEPSGNITFRYDEVMGKCRGSQSTSAIGNGFDSIMERVDDDKELLRSVGNRVIPTFTHKRTRSTTSIKVEWEVRLQ